MNLIGIDFSINKPAATVNVDNDFWFFGWPYQLSQKIVDIYSEIGISIIKRTDNKEKGPDISSKMRYEVRNAQYVSEMISDSLKPWLNKDTYIAFEGVSYGSSGDVVLQLGGYKYMIMSELSKYVPLENMFTYSPITVKKTAGCAEKGKTKNDVIESFIISSRNNVLKNAIQNNREKFMKKGYKNFIDGLDDFVDSYYVLETLRDKELT